MKCIICGGREYQRTRRVLQQCLTCGLIRAHDEAFSFQPNKLYDRQYFFGDEYRNYVEERKNLEWGFRNRLHTILQYKRSGRLLEIGCAYGFFLSLARKYFRVEGIDVSKHAVLHAQKNLQLPVRYGDFVRNRFQKGSYDVICMWDTIEHLQRPEVVIKKIASVLHPDGILCLTTGNIDALVPRIQRERWRLIHPPTHLYYFSEKTLRRLLEKNNLSIMKVSYPWFKHSLSHVLHGLGMKHLLMQALYSLCRENRLFQKLNVIYNPNDIMLVIARNALTGT